MPDELTIEGITIEALMDTWKIELSGMIWEMVNKRPNKRLGFIPNYKHIVDYIANQIAWSKKRKQAELLLERVEKEVIGENDATHINGVIVRQNMMLTRNDMRAEQRTKLTQLKEELTKKD